MLVKIIAICYYLNMKVYAISDLHISTNTNKPMDVFGGNWVNYLEKIHSDWQEKVTDEDVVLIGGDISWAMNIEDAYNISFDGPMNFHTVKDVMDYIEKSK